MVKIICTKPEGGTWSKGVYYKKGGEYQVSKEIADYLTGTFPRWFKLVIEAVIVEDNEPHESVAATRARNRRTATKKEQVELIEK